MRKIESCVLGVTVALTLAAPVSAQNVSLDQVSKEIQELKARNERLEAEVEYLKQETKGQRKDAAKEAVDVETLKAASGKFTWSGDFRYRNEQIKTAPNHTVDEHTRGRDRIRLRFGVTAKINETIAGRVQVATAGGAAGDPRSGNQTLGESWTRKSIGLDLAYVDWKPTKALSMQLGKMPLPWTRTASYFWDGDLTPEGAALKYSSGKFFAGAFYDWLNERHSASGPRSDSKLVGAQVGWKQPLGTSALTLAIGYFDVTRVKDEQVSANAGLCNAYNGTFFGSATNGNTSYSAAGCTRLLSDFNLVNALVQFDVAIGHVPITLFADYMKNDKAARNPLVTEKLDTAFAAGVMINKASGPKSWEAGVIYQQSEADAIFGQFHDSDFADGRTDTDGFAVRAAYVIAVNWTANATYFFNQLNNDTGSAATRDLDYQRLQLDLNYRF